MGILKKDTKKKPAKGKKEVPDEKTAENENQDGNQDQTDTSSSVGNVAELVAEAVTKSNKFTHLMLIGCTIFVTFLISGYGFLAWQTSSRVSGLDDKVQATLDSVQSLSETIATLSDNQGELKDQQILFTAAAADRESMFTEMQENLPISAAEKMSLETDKVVLQIKDLEKSLESQEQNIGSIYDVVSKLGPQLQGFQDRLHNVQKLSEDVQALVVLEKVKYRSVLKRQADLQEKQSGSDPIQIPRDPNMVFYSKQSSD